MLGYFKGTRLYFEKIEWRVIYLLMMNSLQKNLLDILKILLFAYTENTLNG